MSITGEIVWRASITRDTAFARVAGYSVIDLRLFLPVQISFSVGLTYFLAFFSLKNLKEMKVEPRLELICIGNGL